MTPVVEPAADAAALAALHRLAFEDAWRAEDIKALLGSPGVFALAGGLGGQAVGFILCQLAADEAEVLTLAVAPEARRRGVGGALLRQATMVALSRGAEAMFLEVAIDNPGAEALYRAHGFVEVGHRPGYFARPNGLVAARIMRRDLNR